MKDENETLRRARRQFRRAVRDAATPPPQSGAGVFQHGLTPAQREVVRAAQLARQTRRLRQAERQVQAGAGTPGSSLAGAMARAAAAGAAAAIGAEAARRAGVAPATPADQGQLATGQLNNLETQAQLGDVQDALGQIEGGLAQLPLTLDALRRRGYVHSGHLEDRLHLLEEQWDQLRPRVESNLAQQRQALDVELQQTRQRMRQTAQPGALNSLAQQINNAKSALRQMYQGFQSELDEVLEDTRQAEWMLDRLKESPDIVMRATEAPIVACEAQWRQHGDEGPKGILFITDQRLLFEQREDIATKKVLGIFNAESNKLQKLLLEIEVHDLESLEGQEEKGFLGIGKEEILALVCSPKAPMSRVQFELKEWDSAELAALLRRVTSGEIDEDRAEEFIAEVQQADAVVAQFPTECPHCFAPLPPLPRGVSSLVCEYCGSRIAAAAPAA